MTPPPTATATPDNPVRHAASPSQSIFKQPSETGFNDTSANGSTTPAAGSDSTPSMAELELSNKIRQLFFQARQAKRTKVQQWNRNHRVLRNRTWSSERAAWLPTPEVPEIYPILASVVGWMTDQRVQFEISPSAEIGTPYYGFMNALGNDLAITLDTAWKVHEYESEVELSIWDAFGCGTGILKSGWDSSLIGGLGDAVMRRVDPYSFYPDPSATSKRDMNYCIEARTMSLQEMDRRWPGSIDKISSGGWVEDIDTAPNDSDTGGMAKANPAAISPATSPQYGRPGQSRLNAQEAIADPGVTVFECWLREHESIPDPEATSTPDPTGILGHQHVNDTWRVVVIAGNRVLMDESASDLWSHGQHPYDFFSPHRNGEFWGLSMVEMLIPSQIAINRLLAALQMNIELVGNPVLKEDVRAGITRTKVTNKPGQRVQFNTGGTAEWMNPPLLNPLMFQLIPFYIGEMERISGLTAINRGNAPGGRNSADVIDSIQEAAFVRVRLGLRNLEWALRSAGDKLASLICENYTEPRMVAILGPSQNQASRALRGNHFYLPSENGRIPMRFQLLVSIGSQQATSRQARLAEADFLFSVGAIDIPALLEVHDFPNAGVVGPRVMGQLAAGSMEPPGARQRTRGK